MNAVVISNDDNAKEWRSTALRARARRSGPIIGMVALLGFVLAVVIFADMADGKRALLAKTEATAAQDGMIPLESPFWGITPALPHDSERAPALPHDSEREKDDIKEEEKESTKEPPTPMDGTNVHGNPARFSDRQSAVGNAIRWAWGGYRDHAFGTDELQPLSENGHDGLGGLGLTLVDSLDTLWLLGEHEEFDVACSWISTHLEIKKDVEVNVFETTIRVLGGLLSAYNLSGNRDLLDKSLQLGLALATAFESESGIPFSDVNLGSGVAFNPNDGDSSLAEATTLQLEFNYLARCTEDGEQATKFEGFVDRSMTAIHEARKELDNEYSRHGLLPIYVDPVTGELREDAHITLGARGDSYYEYLLKQWLISGKQKTHFLDEYQLAVMGIQKYLVREAGGLTYVGELLNGNKFSPKMDHLACFLPGALALGHASGADPSGHEHLDLAKKLMETCVQGYKRSSSGLAPEIWWFNDDGLYVKSNDAFSLLRPETVESLFYLWRVTGDNRYRDWGWEIFNSFERHAKVDSGGYASLSEISSAAPSKQDKMESFWLAETLKYLFLLFDDQGLLPLDKIVFNTEAHPLPILCEKVPVEGHQSDGPTNLNSHRVIDRRA